MKHIALFLFCKQEMWSQHGEAIRFAIPELKNGDRRLGIGHRQAELIATDYQKAYGSKWDK